MLYTKEDTLVGNQAWLKAWSEKYKGYEHYKKYCSHCGDPFYSRSSKAKYCSGRCVNDASMLRRKERKVLERKKICPICEQPFEAKRKDSLYCSPKCKQKAYRNNKVLPV